EVGDGWGDELDDLPEVPAPTEQNAELQQLRERLQESEELRAKEREELQSRLQEVMQKAKDRIMEMQSRMTEMQETLQERDSQLDRLQAAGLPAAE
ncbi:ANK2, partial [Symbiodinium sp. KB8]